MSTRRAVIFANGVQFDTDRVRRQLQPDDFLIAADAGLRLVHQLGLQADLVIGDLDSLDPAELERLETGPARVERYPAHKDETDLELAVLSALKAGCGPILIVGALGGRLDMTLANIFLLALPELDGVDARLEDGVEEVLMIRPGPAVSIQGRPGDRVSLLPWGENAGGIRTAGLFYPLNGETLYPERTRGISNQMTGQEASVSLETGCLICIHTRMNEEGE